jgi:hypothetical protein
MLPQLRQRIARMFGRDLLLGLIGLRVLRAVALEPRHGQPKQRGRPMLPHMADGAVDQRRRLGGICAVAVEDRQPGEAREVGCDVLARSLIF